MFLVQPWSQPFLQRLFVLCSEKLSRECVHTVDRARATPTACTFIFISVTRYRYREQWVHANTSNKITIESFILVASFCFCFCFSVTPRLMSKKQNNNNKLVLIVLKISTVWVTLPVDYQLPVTPATLFPRQPAWAATSRPGHVSGKTTSSHCRGPGIPWQTAPSLRVGPWGVLPPHSGRELLSEPPCLFTLHSLSKKWPGF